MSSLNHFAFFLTYMEKVSEMAQALAGFLHFLGVQRLPQCLLGQMGVQLHPHPGLAVLGQKVPFVCPEMNWMMSQSIKGKDKQLHQSDDKDASELINTFYCVYLWWERCNYSFPPTQLKDLQGHGEARLLGPHQRPVAGAKVLTGRQQQQHGHFVSKLQQLPGVHTILISLSVTQERETKKVWISLFVELITLFLWKKGDVWNSFYPVEGDVELRQEMCDCCSQRPDELHQAAFLHQALIVAVQQVLNTVADCGVNMTLQPCPLLSVTQGQCGFKEML